MNIQEIMARQAKICANKPSPRLKSEPQVTSTASIKEVMNKQAQRIAQINKQVVMPTVEEERRSKTIAEIMAEQAYKVAHGTRHAEPDFNIDLKKLSADFAQWYAENASNFELPDMHFVPKDAVIPTAGFTGKVEGDASLAQGISTAAGEVLLPVDSPEAAMVRKPRSRRVSKRAAEKTEAPVEEAAPVEAAPAVEEAVLEQPAE